MAEINYIIKDFVTFRYERRNFRTNKTEIRKAMLYWGDKVETIEVNGSKARIRALELFDGDLIGTISTSALGNDPKVMRFSMVDVQQGDGLIIETPPDEQGERRIMTVDGGDNKLFARHLAAVFRHRNPTAASPLPIDVMLLTHGDADHFDGLNDIVRSEKERINDRKRIFVHPKAIYHNGLVKLPGKRVKMEYGAPVLAANGKPKRESRPDRDMFGASLEQDGSTFVIDLVDDPREAPSRPLNRPFERWLASIDHWSTRGPIRIQRIAHGMDADDLFADMAPLRFDIQGPFTDEVDTPEGPKTALRMLHKPRRSSRLHTGEFAPSGSVSDSHTINGHSVSLRIHYGNVRFNLTGDHNQESMAILRERLDMDELESEIVKAPHHGSHDFDYDVLEAMSPVVSIISSGDESAVKEHVHPRATLMAALGRVSRTRTSILLSTELVSFFAMRKEAHTRDDLKAYFKAQEEESFLGGVLRRLFAKTRRSWPEREALPGFFAFERTNFGIIKIRTDGRRVLVFTHTGKTLGHEAYVFHVADDRTIRFDDEPTKA